jgi:hypothetical protein
LFRRIPIPLSPGGLDSIVVPLFRVTIAGEGLVEASAALDQADIRPHDQSVGWITGGAEVVHPRIVANVEANDARGAEARIREVLPQSAYTVTVKPL